MHPLLTRLRGLAAYLLAWWLAGLALAAACVQPPATTWPWALGFALPVALGCGLLALALYPVCRSQPLTPARWISALQRRAAAALLLALLAGGGASLWNALGWAFGRAGLVVLPPAGWLALLAIGFMVFVISALAHDALLSLQAAQAAAAAEAQARLHLRDMELQALRNQIDPHFLFNALNSISALTQLDPAAARAMTIDLAQFFRLTLSMSGRQRIALDEELELVQRYLAIEQRRLGDKLQLAIDADADCRSALLPPLALQPLVENAIKHGIRQLDDGGLIDIRARHDAGRLQLRVANPVEAAAPRDATGLGHGLQHLRARLQAQYAEPTFVDVLQADGRFTVTLHLPWQT
ncbi:sensor histidine kinase [Aquabacterium sp.]|uniref:sensor histidine kinase n=1 Tax=Aquabacterium sp. TaxID=1872578 RepID=UPI0037849685